VSAPQRLAARAGGLMRALGVLSVVVLAGCGSTVQESGSISQDAARFGGSGLASEDNPASSLGTSVGGPVAVRTGGVSTPGEGRDGTTTGAAASGTTGAARGPLNSGTGASTSGSKGRGWDSKNVYIGVITANDIHQYVASLGYSLDPGSVEDDVNAIVKEINARGGLLGRRVVPLFHDNRTAEALANPEATAQANCTYFTQDVQVIGVVSLLANIDTRNFRECMRKQQMPIFAMDFALHDDQSLRESGPHVFTQHANLSQLAKPWIQRLQAQGYFQGWNTTTGGPGPGPAKVGILGDDTAVGQRFIARLSAQLKASGITVAQTFTYRDDVSSYGSSMSAAELSFAAAGVTHVFTAPPTAAATVIFMQDAEQQRYRQRYAMSSYLTPTQLALNVPPAQLNGAVGIGWNPGIDVEDAQDPGSPAQSACLATLARSGVTFTSSQRFAKTAAWALCDAIQIPVAGAARAGKLDPDGLFSGITGLGPRFPVSTAFRNFVTPSHRTITGSARDLKFVNACTCFAYDGPVRVF
jgi:ABC-type branched-subunit amino acid transport system substrate-binding protein